MVFDRIDPAYEDRLIGTVAVASSAGSYTKLSLDLLEALYKDINLNLKTCSIKRPFFGLIFNNTAENRCERIQIDAEVICPVLPLFDSSIFAFNYQNF